MILLLISFNSKIHDTLFGKPLLRQNQFSDRITAFP